MDDEAIITLFFARSEEAPEQVTFTFQIIPDVSDPDYFDE